MLASKHTAPPQFEVGIRVLVEDLGLACHYRMPIFIRGKTGVVERFCGRYPNPEALAYGDRQAPLVELYRVRFSQCDVWENYDGPEHDTVDIEVYRHWMRPANKSFT